MPEVLEDLHFALKARREDGIGGNFLGKQLERHAAVVFDKPRAEHQSHRAGADLLLQLERPDPTFFHRLSFQRSARNRNLQSTRWAA